jgi:hypothetical protein
MSSTTAPSSKGDQFFILVQVKNAGVKVKTHNFCHSIHCHEKLKEGISAA